MSDYSETDLRVIRFLRAGMKSTTAIGRECFRTDGGSRDSGIRPAAAHLARMQSRGLVQRTGRGHRTLWSITEKVSAPGPDLFSEFDESSDE